MPTPDKIWFLVGMDIPSGADPAELMEYVQTEVKAGRGARDPHDPIFNLDRDSVTVTIHKTLRLRGPKF
jgi:hypothetical protein